VTDTGGTTPPSGGTTPPITDSGSGGNPTPIPTPAPTPTLASCTGNPVKECAAYCEGDQAPSFCKILDVTVTLTQIGGGVYNGGTNCNNAAGAATDVRCKRCGAAERNAGSCLKISVCPPWIDSSACTGHGNGSQGGADNDHRIHQMISIN
jgi:hypothetical protein